MSKEQEEQEFHKIFNREFNSSSDDPGVAYVENFFKRKIETINSEDIIKALLNAAKNGSGVPGERHLMFVRKLICSKLSLMSKLTREERHKVFVEASKHDNVLNIPQISKKVN